MKPRKDAKNTEVNNNVKKEAVSQRNIFNLKHCPLKIQFFKLALAISENFEFEVKSCRCVCDLDRSKSGPNIQSDNF